MLVFDSKNALTAPFFVTRICHTEITELKIGAYGESQIAEIWTAPHAMRTEII